MNFNKKLYYFQRNKDFTVDTTALPSKNYRITKKVYLEKSDNF